MTGPEAAARFDLLRRTERALQEARAAIRTAHARYQADLAAYERLRRETEAALVAALSSAPTEVDHVSVEVHVSEKSLDQLCVAAGAAPDTIPDRTQTVDELRTRLRHTVPGN